MQFSVKFYFISIVFSYRWIPSELQQEQPVEEGDLKKKEEVQAYKPPIPFP